MFDPRFRRVLKAACSRCNKVIAALLSCQLNPSCFACFQPSHSSDCDERLRWYTSCVVQHESEQLERVLKSLPSQGIPSQWQEEQSGQARVRHGKCVWIFLGQNLPTAEEEGGEDGGREAMRGRPEHTDMVRHAGTWHMQISGTKTWRIRPSEDGWPEGSSREAAAKRVQEEGEGEEVKRLKIVCQAGDLLVINTKAWFHQTEIPSSAAADGNLSVSVARDFSFVSSKDEEGMEVVDMTNIESSWAAGDVEEGELVLKEGPLVAVQDPSSRAEYLCCSFCVRPLLDHQQEFRYLTEQTSLIEALRDNRPPGLPAIEASDGEEAKEEEALCVEGFNFCCCACRDKELHAQVQGRRSRNGRGELDISQQRMLVSLSSGHYMSFELVRKFFILLVASSQGLGGGGGGREHRAEGGGGLFTEHSSLDRLRQEFVQLVDMKKQSVEEWWDLVAAADMEEKLSKRRTKKVEVELHRGPFAPYQEADQVRAMKLDDYLTRMQGEEHGTSRPAKRSRGARGRDGGGDFCVAEKAYGLVISQKKPFVVETVFPGGAAAASGVREGDVLIRIDDRAVKERRDLEEALAEFDQLAMAESQKLFGDRLPSLWCSLAWTLERRKGIPEGDHEESERRRESLRRVAVCMWSLLVAEFAASELFKVDKELLEFLSWERYSQTLLFLHLNAWEVGDGSTL
eukprot:303524-Hanusia_phi.AAC.1